MVTILSFSSRKDGNSAKIAKFLGENIQNATVYSFADFYIEPCGKCDYQCFVNRLDCPFIGDMEYPLLEAICSSEMVYFVVPNYCDYPNANYFIFNERSNCFFQGQTDLLEQYLNVPKKFVVVSNSQSDHFLEAFTQQVNETPEILFLHAKQFGKRAIDGDLLDSKEVERKLKAFL